MKGPTLSHSGLVELLHLPPGSAAPLAQLWGTTQNPCGQEWAEGACSLELTAVLGDISSDKLGCECVCEVSLSPGGLCQRQQRQPESTWSVPDVHSVCTLWVSSTLWAEPPVPATASLPAHQSSKCQDLLVPWALLLGAVLPSNDTIAVFPGPPAIPAAAWSSSVALAVQGHPCGVTSVIRGTLCTAEPSLAPVLAEYLCWDRHWWASASLLTYTEHLHTTLSFPLVFIIWHLLLLLLLFTPHCYRSVLPYAIVLFQWVLNIWNNFFSPEIITPNYCHRVFN